MAYVTINSTKTIISNGRTYVNKNMPKVRIKQGFFEVFPVLVIDSNRSTKDYPNNVDRQERTYVLGG